MFRFLVIQSVAFLSCLGFQFAAAHEPILVISYNIRYQNEQDGEDHWQNRKETVISTIRQADIIGLQEVVGNQFDEVRQGTQEWSWYGVGRDDGLLAGEIVPIGWRTDRFVAVEQGTFWLGDYPYEIGKKNWDAALPRTASWVRLVPRVDPIRTDDSSTVNPDSKLSEQDNDPAASSHPVSEPLTILVINTHFDHVGKESKKRSARQLRTWIARHRDKSEVILMGDLNARPESEPLKELLLPEKSQDAPLLDARASAPATDPGPDGTWNGFKEIQIGARIDFILYQGERLKVTRFETLNPRTPTDRFGSDHLPVLSQFDVN